MRPFFWAFAKESGYGAEFIDMYDEWRVKVELEIPWHHVLVSIIALGYSSEEGQKPVQLDEEVIH